MATVVFVVLQLTLILAMASVVARWTIPRSPQLASVVCLVGIFLAVVTIPVATLPIPKWSLGGLLKDGATHSTWLGNASQSDRDHKSQGNESQGKESQRSEAHAAHAASPVGGGVNFLRVLSQLQQSAGMRPMRSSYLMICCLAAWCLLACLGAVKLAVGLCSIWQLKISSQPYVNMRLHRETERWTQRHRSLPQLELRISDRVASPCVTTLDRKTIYLPPAFAAWPVDEQLAVLAHEAAHLTRSDAQWRLAFGVLRQVLNFNPLAWILNRQFVLAQEMSADQLAGQLLSADGYRKGLCKLALRMDAQPQLSQVSLGVSVSTNSLVRRIKMLNSPTRRGLAGWQQLLAITLVATSGVGVALCTARADDPLRIATRVKNSPTTTPAFTRFTSQPWEEIGVHNGYFRVLPSVAAQRPMLKKPMDEFSEGIGLSNLECGIQLSRDWISWTSNIDFKIRKHDASNNDGHQYSLQMLGDKPLVEFAKEVDWVEVSEKVNLAAFSTEDNRVALKKFLAEQGRSKTLRAISNSTSDYGNYRIAKLLWPVIDGGVTAAVFPLAELSKVDSKYKKGELASEVISVAGKCSFVGIGVDFESSDSLCQVRLAFVPANDYSATTIAEEAKAALAAILNSMQDTDEMTEAEKLTQAKWQSELEAWTVNTKAVSEELGEIVIIEGAISDASMVFPLM